MRDFSTSELRRRFDAAADRAVRRILRKYSNILGIIVDGSVGRGSPSPHSDVDLLAITKSRRRPDPFSYFDENIYIGIGFLTLKQYSDQAKRLRQFYWARGGALSARILYDPKKVVAKILRTNRNAKTTSAIVEDVLGEAYHNIVEYIGKLQNGWLVKDEFLTRYAARVIAQHCQEALIALNDISPMSENFVWHQVLGRGKSRPISHKTILSHWASRELPKQDESTAQDYGWAKSLSR